MSKSFRTIAARTLILWPYMTGLSSPPAPESAAAYLVAGHASLDPGLGGMSLDDGRNGYGAQPGSRLAGHGQGVARLEAAASVGVQETPGRSEGGVVFP